MEMTDTILKQWLVCCLLILMPLAAQSAPPQWQIVPAESHLTFTATQNGAPFSGEFKKFTGHILFDPNDVKNSSVGIVVDINSMSVSYAQLKETLVTPDWFSAALFPKAEFKSTSIEKTGDKTYRAKGMLTIRDKTVPIIFTFTGEQPNPNKGVVTGSTVIKRSQFGVGQGEWASTKEVKDEVTVSFKVVGVRKG